jgi:hypothetical protein
MSNVLNLNEEEKLNSGRVMLKAALDALGKFPESLEDDDSGEMTRRVVAAMVAASNASKSEIQRHRKQGFDCNFLATSPSDAVATAFWMRSECIDFPVSEVHPASIGGNRLLAFARGMTAAKLMSEAMYFLEESEPFSFSEDGAEAIFNHVNRPLM